MSLTAVIPRATAVKYSLTARTANAACRRALTLHDQEDKLDAYLQFNEREVLTHASTLHTDVAGKVALKRHESFEAAPREAARLAADEADIMELEDIGKAAKKGRNNGGKDA